LAKKAQGDKLGNSNHLKAAGPSAWSDPRLYSARSGQTLRALLALIVSKTILTIE
jgi:hypothetical protein